MTLKLLLDNIKQEMLSFPCNTMKSYTVATEVCFYGTKESEAFLKFLNAAIKIKGKGLENTEIPELELQNLISLFIENQYLIKGWFDLLETDQRSGIHVNGTRFYFDYNKNVDWDKLFNLLGIYNSSDKEQALKNCGRLKVLFTLFDTLNHQYKINARTDWDVNPFPRPSAKDLERIENFIVYEHERAEGIEDSRFNTYEIEDLDSNTWKFWQDLEGFEKQPEFKPFNFLELAKETKIIYPLKIQRPKAQRMVIDDSSQAARGTPTPQPESLWQTNATTNPLEVQQPNAEEMAINNLFQAARSTLRPHLESLWDTTPLAPSNASSTTPLPNTFTLPPGGFASMILETTPEGFCHLSLVKFLIYLDPITKEIELPNFPFFLTFKIFFLLKKNYVLFYLKLKFYYFWSSYKSKFR